MKVKKTSWHFKAWKWMQDKNKPLPTPTVCGYWIVIVVGIPLACWSIAAMALWAAVLYPFAWLIDKLEARFKGKTICPFGKVEIEP